MMLFCEDTSRQIVVIRTRHVTMLNSHSATTCHLLAEYDKRTRQLIVVGKFLQCSICHPQVLEDISELRKKWVQARVDRVSNNTYKLYQVRKSLKQSKVSNKFSF